MESYSKYRMELYPNNLKEYPNSGGGAKLKKLGKL